MARLHSALLREFPDRKDLSQMTVIDRSRLYSAVSEVVRDASRQLFRTKNVFLFDY